MLIIKAGMKHTRMGSTSVVCSLRLCNPSRNSEYHPTLAAIRKIIQPLAMGANTS